jgi:hypothetical protein
MAGVMRRLLTKARPAYNYAKRYSVSVRMNKRMKTCPWSLTRINQNDARADTDNQPSACLESRHNSQRIKSRAKKKERKKENISLLGFNNVANAVKGSYSFPGGVLCCRVYSFLLCALFLLLAIVTLFSGRGTFLHLPGWHTAIEE